LSFALRWGGFVSPSYHRPCLLNTLYNEIMRGPGSLSRQEREMIATVAAAAQDCYY